ncbi:hypothetical protein [Gracilimonas mengyeensis]|uniref:ERF1 domain-containing protein 3 n=1 Tax=Gracilimonas mengyeensis TaxID=1302730 RepID=A0A521B8T0_9BACT|nr:hypothetical protein [Gracilimonas mengyeensis]SMO43473.1 hypothetical protein SAMN06265219_102102 [Gracilimonas mengyeensis]
MSVVNRETIEKLISETGDSNISIFIPTHKKGEEAKQDSIRLKNILQKVRKDLLEDGWKEPDVDELFKKVHAKTEENQFWLHQDKGLALYINDHYFDFFKIPVSPEENYYIAENFLITPLLELQNHHGVYHVLVLSQSETKMFNIAPDTTTKVPFESVPTSMEEHLKYHEHERSVQHHTATSGGRAVFHGQGADVDENNKELELFLKHIENKVTKYLKKVNGPLILAGPDKLVSYYKKCNKYFNVLDETLSGNADDKSVKEIEDESWEIAKSYFKEEIESDIERFNNLNGSELISTDVSDIVKGAYYGKVDTLFVPMGFRQFGVFDTDENEVQISDQMNGSTIDLINYAAVSAIRTGSTLYGLPQSEIPNSSGLAAIYRYKT